MEGLPMGLIVVDEAGLTRDLVQAISDCKAAESSQYNRLNPFGQGYGPGLMGVSANSEAGTYYIHATRYQPGHSAETVINVHIVVADKYWPAPEKTVWAAGVEQMLLSQGAIIHSSGYPLRGYHFTPDEPAVWGICGLWNPHRSY
jgi:hypothetical protein